MAQESVSVPAQGPTAPATTAAPASTAALLAGYLHAVGVQHVFGYPGESVIDFMEAARQQGIALVSAVREGTAAFMAEAAAMATGRLGVCLSTLGPGSTAVLNGVASATLDRVPVLAVSGQIESSREQFFTHQVVDHGRMFAPVTKLALRLEPASADTVIRKALRTVVAERPGAVHLTVTADAWLLPPGAAAAPAGAAPAAAAPAGFIPAGAAPAGAAPAGAVPVGLAPAGEAHDGVGPAVVPPPLTVAAGSVDVYGDGDPLQVLRAARRPVILAGIAALRCAAGPELADLAERAGIPVVVSPMAKGIFPEDHPYFAGVLDMAGHRVVWDLLAAADLILTAGFDPVELISPWSVSTPVVHLDTTPNTDQVYASAHELVGHVGALLRWVTAQWSGQPRWTEAQVAAHRARLRAAWLAGRTEGKLNPSDVVLIARQAAPPDTIVTTDVGSHKIMTGQAWQAGEPRSVLMSNGLSAMGFGVPAAIAAKLTRPDRPVMALVGDGGFAMTATEMRIAAALDLPITVVVFTDNSLNRIELRQQLMGYPPTATRMGGSDLAALAEAMGCDGVRVDTTPALEKALADFGPRSRASSGSRPLVIEARIDPAQYEAQF
jgi:acetolactate synthase I/II/III large subunit